MALIVGLGNVGAKYENTRHNVGFEVVDQLADNLSISFRENGLFYIGEGSFKSRPVTLIKPTTLMNRSGRAVTKALAVTGDSPEEMMVCYDDINLPPGKIRVRPSGSAGGHNGIQDIIDQLNTNRFPRLRVGIGNDFSRGRQADYVLSPFSDEQRPDVDQAIEHAGDAIITFLRAGIDIAMNEFN